MTKSIKKSDFVIDPDNLFENDLLERKGKIVRLSKLVENKLNHSYVVAVDASWGAGKTTFIRLWQEHLRSECEVESFYFSAWEDDYSDNPLIAILNQLNKYIIGNEERFEKSIFEKLKKILEQTRHQAIKIALKVVEKYTHLDAEILNKILLDEENIIEKLKTNINEIINEVGKDKSFIIFIDELDRCRPSYSIECLERVKHIFNIAGLIFILAIDKKNLSKTIRSQYGNIDIDNYLRRFFDLETQLSNESIQKYSHGLWLETKKKYDSENYESYASTYKDVGNVLEVFKLSPREIEQIIDKVFIILNTSEVNNTSYFYENILLFLVALQLSYNEIYNKVISGDFVEPLIIEEIINKLNLPKKKLAISGTMATFANKLTLIISKRPFHTLDSTNWEALTNENDIYYKHDKIDIYYFVELVIKAKEELKSYN